MYGEGAVTDQTCQKWFVKFRAGDFSLDEAPRSARPVGVDSDQIKTLRTIDVIPWRRYLTQSNSQINKVISENEKCVFYGKSHTDSLANPIYILVKAL